MADATGKTNAFTKVLGYVKAQKKPLAIGGGTGLVLGAGLTLVASKLKGKKGKK